MVTPQGCVGMCPTTCGWKAGRSRQAVAHGVTACVPTAARVRHRSGGQCNFGHRRLLWLSSSRRPQPHPPSHCSRAAATVEPVTQQQVTHVSDSDDFTPEEEGLQLLEWPAVCAQVASFCGTSMAAELLQGCGLPLGSSQADSEVLLEQTAEAMEAGLKVAGVVDFAPLLEGVATGGVCNARQLEGIAASLEAAFRLKEVVGRGQASSSSSQQEHASSSRSTSSASRKEVHQQRAGGNRSNSSSSSSSQVRTQEKRAAGSEKGGSKHCNTDPHHQQQQQQSSGAQPLLPRLEQLAAGIGEEQRAMLALLRRCVRSAALTDEASPRLAALRAERTANATTLRALVSSIGAQLLAAKAADTKEPVLLRGRLAVAVKKGSRGALSKGSMRLGASGSGATLYVEPVEAIELNNRETALADEEAEEEEKVLVALSRQLAAVRPGLEALLGAVASLDVVAARAAHAAWLGAVRPRFSSWPGGSAAGVQPPLQVPGALHPLLLAPALPPLPRAPSRGDLTPDLVEAPAWATSPEQQQQQREGGSGEVSRPRPLDLVVPGGARVVAITGPNTGGKTVTLKTAGLMVLLAKAGCYLPVDPSAAAAAAEGHTVSHTDDHSDGASSSSSSSSSEGSGSTPELHWFDRVLVDIGDSQSLQQSLSTFSGHVRRLRRVLGAAGPASLVLLDEVGSGTDPLEGAALARAVLDNLAGTAGLTVATTHHAELKTAAEEDERYVNVSMEFDTATLRPTYRLAWGRAGASNALDIAAALGFDAAVLAEARQLLAAQQRAEAAAARGRGGGSGASSMEEVAMSIEQQLEELQVELEEVQRGRAAAEGALAEVTEAVAALRATHRALRAAPQRIRLQAAEAVLGLQVALVQYRRGEVGEEELDAAFQPMLERAAAAASQAAGQEGPRVWQVGDHVLVKDMGDLGTAVVSRTKGQRVWVATLLGEVERDAGDLLPAEL